MRSLIFVPILFVFFALALDYFASFNAAAYACMVGLSLLLITALVTPQRRDRAPTS